MGKSEQLEMLPEMTPGETLRQWRERKRWSRARAAEHLGVSERTIENWEYGIRTPKALKLWAADRRLK